MPPGRVGCDLDAGRLLLHTVESARAFDALITTGALRLDPALADADSADAYRFCFQTPRSRDRVSPLIPMI